ncbi:hypothetical protein RhiirB3_485159 [Rhizophagus irregularis]|nr:hypothetical protein RhiirB3_485159 [Rhizophagus irregularis]
MTYMTKGKQLTNEEQLSAGVICCYEHINDIKEDIAIALEKLKANNILDFYSQEVEFADSVKINDKYFEPQNILNSIFKLKSSIRTIRWIPFPQFTDIKEITKGGYGIIYKATWSSKNETVILKRFENSKNISKYFLNELKALLHCIKNYNGHLIKTYGFTKDPELEDYIIVMKYASEGDLHSLSSQNLNSTIQNFSSSLDSNYISKELELDIESLSTQNLNSTIQNFSTSKYISAELELDIESLSSTNQNFQTSLVKRRIESLNVETHDDSGKYVKSKLKYFVI